MLKLFCSVYLAAKTPPKRSSILTPGSYIKWYTTLCRILFLYHFTVMKYF